MLRQPKSHVVGLIGRGIKSSRSPSIHENEAAAMGLPLAYRIVDFMELDLPDAELPRIIDLLAGIGFSGCNVTYPFKQSTIARCDSLSEAAAALGAVNTLVFADGKIHGENTDWTGFHWLIERDIGPVAGACVAQVGAGGAGSATAYALARLGVDEVAIFDPEAGRAQGLVERLSPHFPACRFLACADAASAVAGRQGVVNATPVGMVSLPGMPFAPDLLKPGQWLADIIYFPLETSLLGAARRGGNKVANGVSMVVGQAAEAFRLFTGLAPDRERMLARLESEIAAERKLGDAA